MGDVLGGVFGSGGKTETDNKLDPQSEAANKIRLQQLTQTFAASPYASYAYPQPDVYTGTPAVDDLFRQANSPNGSPAAAPSYSPFDMSAFQTAPSAASAMSDNSIPASLTQSYGAPQLPDVRTLRDRPALPAPNNYDDLMSLDDYIKMGLDQSGNYISQIARPEIMQAASLQGLDRGNFVSEAIAKATAGIALPFIQSLPEASQQLALARPQAEAIRAGTALTNAQEWLTGPQGDLIHAQAGLTDAQRAKMGLEMGLLGAQTGLTQAQTGLTEAEIGRTGAQTGLFGSQAGLTEAQTGLTGAQAWLTAGPQAGLVGAQTGLTNAQAWLAGPQAGLLNAQKASTLFPLADYSRGLKEQDLLRRQGVVTTGLTGLPFTPVTDSTAKKSSQPLFNFFGQG